MHAFEAENGGIVGGFYCYQTCRVSLLSFKRGRRTPEKLSASETRWPSGRYTGMDDPPTLLQPGRNCWRIAQAKRASVIVDAADYYRLAKRAMLQARQQIILVGWDFDSRIFLDREAADEEPTEGVPNELGRFIQWLADQRPELCIHILKWDVGAFKLLGRGTTLFRLARWIWHKRITFKLDGAHPKGASHHQKSWSSMTRSPSAEGST